MLFREYGEEAAIIGGCGWQQYVTQCDEGSGVDSVVHALCNILQIRMMLGS